MGGFSASISVPHKSHPMRFDGVRQRGVYFILNPSRVTRVFIIQIVDKDHLGKQFLRWVELLPHLFRISVAETTQIFQGSPSALPKIQRKANILSYFGKLTFRSTVFLQQL